MKIACLQFAPELGQVQKNQARANAILCRQCPESLDLLVLPELAFSGYNFSSSEHISPFLEEKDSGSTFIWARTQALKYDCHVACGYPEKVNDQDQLVDPQYYNSLMIINPSGEIVENYRKTHLYYTDETWALEGSGFYAGQITGLGDVSAGICMDINPYQFKDYAAYEFANHVLLRKSNLVVISTAWLTHALPTEYLLQAYGPDMETLSYWLARLEPIIRAEDVGEVIIVFANRCGQEGQALYAGTSVVMGIDKGVVRVYGILGRGNEELLVVDTEKEGMGTIKLVPKIREDDSRDSNGHTEGLAEAGR